MACLPGLQWGEYKRNRWDCFSMSCSTLFIWMPGLMAGQAWSEPCTCVCTTVWVWTPPTPSASAELRESLLRLSWKRNGQFHTEKRFFSFWQRKKTPEGGFLSSMSNRSIKKEAPSTTHSQCGFSLLCHICVWRAVYFSPLVAVFLFHWPYRNLHECTLKCAARW